VRRLLSGGRNSVSAEKMRDEMIKKEKVLC